MADRHQAQAYPLRIPDELKNDVMRAAAVNGRSLNAEIAARLAASFNVPPNAPELAEKAAELQDHVDLLRHYIEVLRLIPAGFGTRILSVLNQLPPSQRAQLAGAQALGEIAEAARSDDAEVFVRKWSKFINVGGQQELFAPDQRGPAPPASDGLAGPAQKAAEALAAEPAPLEPRPSKPRKPIAREALRDGAAQAPLEPRPVTSAVRKIITREPEAPKAVGSTVSARRINLRKK